MENIEDPINALAESIRNLQNPTPPVVEQKTEAPAETQEPKTEPVVEATQQTTETKEPKPSEQPTGEDEGIDIEKELAALRGETGETKEVPQQAIDLGIFKEALGKEYKSLDEVIPDVKAIKEKYEAIEITLANIPPELRNAMELAANGADYLELLQISSINYDLVADADYIRNEYITANKGKGTEAELLEQADEFIQSKNPTELKMIAEPYRRAMKERQAMEVSRFKEQAVSRKMKIQSDLQGELDKTDKIFGLKVTPSDRKAALDNLAKGISGKYKNADGSVNAKQAVMNELLQLKFEDIIKTAAHRAKVETKTQMVVETSNVDLKKTTPTAPVIESSNGKSRLENHLDFLQMSR